MRYHNPERYLWHSAKGRAKRSNQKFTITDRDFRVPASCPILGVPFVIEPGMGRNDYSPSLDRIDNSKGYEPGNIWVISDLANRMKSSATKEELLIFAKSVLIIFNT